MTFTPFETARLRLRPQEARDAGFALCIWGDPITGKYLSDPVLDDIDDLNKYMELLRSLSDSTDCYYVIAEDKVTHQPIGTCCAVVKDGGDDPDVTSGSKICATVTADNRGDGEKELLQIDGGKGVGRVTRPGLDQPVGNAAINHVPREMITREVQEVCRICDFHGTLHILISVPDGEALAERTFNPRLGIVGGISILGTTGIVEPMSSQALKETIRVELRQQRAEGQTIAAVSPGNYGLDFMQQTYGYDLDRSVKCSNFIGETIDMAAELGFCAMLLTGHIGKLIKVAGGIMNTHSHEGDCRMELLAAAGIRENVSLECLKKILDCVTTEEALAFIDAEGKKEDVMEDIMKKIDFYLKKRAAGRLQIECIVYSNTYGLLGMTAKAEELLRRLL